MVGEWQPEKYDCVFTDDVRGSTDITRYLIAEGHRNIWYIGNQRLPGSLVAPRATSEP